MAISIVLNILSTDGLTAIHTSTINSRKGKKSMKGYQTDTVRTLKTGVGKNWRCDCDGRARVRLRSTADVDNVLRGMLLPFGIDVLRWRANSNTHFTELTFHHSVYVALPTMGARRIFSRGGANSGCTLFLKKLVTFFSLTTNAQNTLQHFQGATAPLPLPAGARGCRGGVGYDRVF